MSKVVSLSDSMTLVKQLLWLIWILWIPIWLLLDGMWIPLLVASPFLVIWYLRLGNKKNVEYTNHKFIISNLIKKETIELEDIKELHIGSGPLFTVELITEKDNKFGRTIKFLADKHFSYTGLDGGGIKDGTKTFLRKLKLEINKENI